MKIRVLVISMVFICVGAVSISAQDTLHANPESVTLNFENERVRVLEIVMLPGTRDKPHSHPDYVTYVLSGGRFRVYPKDGAAMLGEFKTGEVLFRGSQSHWAENIGTTAIRLIVLEFKDGGTSNKPYQYPAGKDTLTANQKTVTLKFENDKVRVLESVLKPGMKEKEHSHPDYVTYAISGGKVRNYMDGTISPGEFKSGDVLFRDARTHRSDNVGSTTIRVIMFELKGGKM
jgi:quercetin dioxygenase-like cupin family protein